MEQVGATVLMKLCQPYFNLNHVLYADNFYTFVPLYQSLLENGMYSWGNAKKNNTGFPKTLKNDSVWEKEKARGAVRSTRVGDVLCLQWKDKRVTKMFPPIIVETIMIVFKGKLKWTAIFNDWLPTDHRLWLIITTTLGVLISPTRCLVCFQYN